MLGYFDPFFPGELLQGAIARTARLAGLSAHYDMPLLALGRHTRHFGLHFPTHGRDLLANLPSSLGYDEETILSHSLFPAYAPFLEDAQRLKLETSILDGKNRGKLCRDSLGPLHYCPGCAAKDLEEYHTVYWHTLPQHPGALACIRCKSELVKTDATIGIERRLLHAPDWINATLTPVAATGTALQLAHDLEWLIFQNKERPGGRSLASALRQIVQSNHAYRRGAKTIRLPKLVDDIRSHYSDALLGRIGLHHDWRMGLAISTREPSLHFQAYSVVAHVAGSSLPEIFALATQLNRRGGVAPAGQIVSGEQVARAKQQIQQYLHRVPQAHLKQLCALRPRALATVRKHDPRWCEENLPKRKHRAPRASPNAVNWSRRDIEWAQELTQVKDRLLTLEQTGKPTRIVRRLLLEVWGRRKWLTRTELALLPLTKQSLVEALDSRSTYVKRRAEWAITHFIKTRRKLGFKCFLEFGGMSNDIERCPVALAIATEAWQRYRNQIDPPVVTRGEFG